MSRRVYMATVKRKRLLREALSTVHETRNAIDPGLLEQARLAIGGALERIHGPRMRPMQLDRVPIDRKKNLSVVLKYLELQPDNKAAQQEVRAFLTRH